MDGGEPAQGRTIWAGIDEAIEVARKQGTAPRAIYLTKEDHARFEREMLDLWREDHPKENTAYVSMTHYRDIPVRLGETSALYSESGAKLGVKRPRKARPSTL